ncbi:MAG: TolC family protein [Lachnospiraceae bacterium]
MKKKRYMAAILALSCSLSGTVLAAGPVADKVNTGYDEATWARLMDDVLEYDEVPLLVHVCNETISEIWEDLDTAKQKIQDNVDELESQRRRLGETIDETKNEAANIPKDDEDAQKAMAELQYMYDLNDELLDSAAKSLKNSGLKQLSSKTNLASIQRAEDQITQVAQSLMISYDTLCQQKTTLEHLQALYAQQYQLAVNKRAQGLATDTEVLAAQANQLSAQSNIASIEGGLLKLKPTICSLTGWAADADPQIAAIPAVDLSPIDDMNLDADTVKAIGNNTTMMELRRSEAGKTNDGIAARLAKIEEGEQKVTIELKALYDDVFIKKTAYESALIGFQSAQKSQEGSDRMYSLGMLSKSEYLGTQVTYYQKEAAFEAADTALRLSIETYQWAVRGFLAIE